MNKQLIIDTVRQLAPSIRPRSDLTFLPPQSDRYRQLKNQDVSALPAVVQQLTTILRSDPALQLFKKTHMYRSPYGSSLIENGFDRIARWLLAQSLRRSPEEVVDQLEWFVSTNSIRVQEVLALSGIHPTQSISIYPGIELVPLNSLASTDWSNELLGGEAYLFDSTAMYPRVDAALVREFEFGPVLRSSPTPTAGGEGGYEQTDKRREFMWEIARCLVLVEASPVFPLFLWYQSDETTPLLGGALTLHGWGFTWHHTFETEPKPYNEEVKSLVSNYFDLDETTRQRLRVPLTRLNSSMMGSNELEDMAIDLGIAMEALLTSDRESDAPVSYLVRQRGTLLLGGNPETRRQNYYRLRELYNLRSTAAHGGTIEAVMKMKLSSGKTKVNSWEFLDEGTRLCVEMIREVIQRGGIPDWDALTLGW